MWCYFVRVLAGAFAVDDSSTRMSYRVCLEVAAPPPYLIHRVMSTRSHACVVAQESAVRLAVKAGEVSVYFQQRERRVLWALYERSVKIR